MNLLSKFATCVSDGVDGKGSTDGGVEMNDLYGGARISYIFNEVRMYTPALHPSLFMFLHRFNLSPPHTRTQTLSYEALRSLLVLLHTCADGNLLHTTTHAYIYIHIPYTYTYIYITYTVGIWPYHAVSGPL